LFAKLQQLSLRFYGHERTGDLLQRIGADVFVVQAAVLQVALPATISLLSLAAMFAIMASLDFTLALVALGVVPLLGLSLALLTKPLNDATNNQYRCTGLLMAFVEQSLAGIKIIQGFAREPLVQAKLEDKAAELSDAYKRFTHV